MDDVGSNNLKDLQKLVESEGDQLRIVFDNFDFRVLANVALLNHKNADMHWIAQFATFDWIPSNHLDYSKPLVSDINEFENKEYLLTKDELTNSFLVKNENDVTSCCPRHTLLKEQENFPMSHLSFQNYSNLFINKPVIKTVSYISHLTRYVMLLM